MKTNSSIPFICQDDMSGCMIEHAPMGSSHADYIELRNYIGMRFGDGCPFDASYLNDDWIEFIAQYCAQLRINNKG